MRNIFKSKRGIAPLFLILMIVFILIVIYCLLFIPIPAFTKVRMIVNYFLIIILWITIQTGLIFGYYKLISFAIKGFGTGKKKIANLSLKMKKYIISHT
jgi:hypothetical protein